VVLFIHTQKFQWCGMGNPLSDVAYFLSTSLDESLLLQSRFPLEEGGSGGGRGGSVEEDDAAAERVVTRLLQKYEDSLGMRLVCMFF